MALRTAAEDTAKQLGFDMIDFTVYPDVEHVPPRYTYFMEIESLPEDESKGNPLFSGEESC